MEQTLMFVSYYPRFCHKHNDILYRPSATTPTGFELWFCVPPEIQHGGQKPSYLSLKPLTRIH